MIISREKYEAWDQRHADLTSKISAQHRDWIGPVNAFADEVVRDCPDVAVTGWARLAHSHATDFRDAKRDAKLEREYRNFLSAWMRLGGMFSVHLNAP